MKNIHSLIEEEGEKWRVPENRVAKIKEFYENLKEWNKKINLVSRKDFENHFISLLQISLWFSNFLSPFDSFIDVGSGGGFPSIIFKALNPQIRGILIEPSLKKSFYLKSITERLGFDKELEVMRMDFKSAIHLIKKRKEKMDYITAIGFKKKEQIIREISMAKKGVSFITGEMEIKRLQEIEFYKNLEWLVETIPGRDFIKGVKIRLKEG